MSVKRFFNGVWQFCSFVFWGQGWDAHVIRIIEF